MSEPWRDRIQPGPDLFAAVGRHLALFALPIVVLALIGVGYGLVRSPQYTAEARVTIGQLSLTTQGLPGFLTAAGNLAAAYSRTIDATEVSDAAARYAHVSPDEAADALTSSAIPNTPLFRIEAEYGSPDTAIKLANGAADAIIEHILELNRRDDTRGMLLTKYESASKKIIQLRKELAAAKGEDAESVGAELAAAKLRHETIAQLYGAAASGDVAQNLLQVAVRPTKAESDRGETIRLWGLVGALVGVLLGLALAAAAEARELRERAAEPREVIAE